MAANIQMRTDVSYLFSGLGGSQTGSAGVAASNFLADYASIKNGSYGKLMKAYYSETASDTVKSITKNKTTSSVSTALSKEETKEYAKLETTTDALKESADALLNKALYEEKNEDKDEDKLYQAVNSFVADYNAVLKAAENTTDGTVLRRVESMKTNTASMEKTLASVGITIGEDASLSMDKAAFDKAALSKVKSLFQGNGSYGYQISAQASLINYAADKVINRGSIYTTSGSYSTGFSNGNLFSTYF